MVLDGKFSQYPVNTGVPQSSSLDPTLLVLYIKHLSNDVICNVAIYVDHTTLYSKFKQAFDFWQHLQLASELKSDLQVTIDWDMKWLVDFDTCKTQLVSLDQSSSGAIYRNIDKFVPKKNHLLSC